EHCAVAINEALAAFIPGNMESGSVLDEVSNHLHSLNAFRACEACLDLAICGLGQHGSVIALDESLLCPEVCRLLHIETIFSRSEHCAVAINEALAAFIPGNMESGSVLDEVSNHLHSLNAFRACEACLDLAICGLGQHGSVIALDESLLCPEVCRLLHIETIFS